MIEDSELLRRYVDDHLEAAFTELVRRHLDLVYSAALRQTNGNSHRAEDVAQAVFSDLARKATQLSRHPTLRGWLYTSTHFAAAKFTRAESRRQIRENEAFVMQEILSDSTPAPDWNQLRLLLDRAMHELNESHREVILLRFFDQRPFADIAAKSGISENAARKSVDRALEKLGTILTRRGITSTTGALAIALADHAVMAAPPGLVAKISGTALMGAASGGVGFSAFHIMATTKLKIGVIGLLVAGAGILIFQHHGNATLASEIGGLREQLQKPVPLRARAAKFIPSATSGSPGTSGVVQPTGSLAREMHAASTWKNVGRATPAAFVETYWWSIKEMNLDTFITTWDGIDDAGKQMAQAYFDTLPEETQAKYGTAERLIAKLIMWATTVHPVAGFQVTDVETLASGEVNVHVRVQLPNGEEQTMTGGVAIHQSPDGWRSGLLPAQNVEKALYGGRYLLKFENLPSPPPRAP